MLALPEAKVELARTRTLLAEARLAATTTGGDRRVLDLPTGDNKRALRRRTSRESESFMPYVRPSMSASLQERRSAALPQIDALCRELP